MNIKSMGKIIGGLALIGSTLIVGDKAKDMVIDGYKNRNDENEPEEIDVTEETDEVIVEETNEE